MEWVVETLKANVEVANAVATIFSVCVALVALLVSVLSVVVSVKALKHQREHNVLTVTPLAEVAVADYENSLRVKLCNNGTGPLIVRSLTVEHGGEERQNVIDWMPALPPERPWTNFSGAMAGRSLQPGSVIVLLELTRLPGDIDFQKHRDLVRAALAPLAVRVSYTDVYGSDFAAYRKSLVWFGRNLAAYNSRLRK